MPIHLPSTAQQSRPHRSRLRRAAAGTVTALALSLAAAPVVLTTTPAVAAAPSDVKFEYAVNGNFSATTVTTGSTVRLRLTAQNGGEWVTQEFAWKVDGGVVEGATSHEFTPRPGDAGKKLEAVVTIKRGTFAPFTFTEVVSASIAPSRPVVSVSGGPEAGRAVAGQTLTMTHDMAALGATQWNWIVTETRSNSDGSTYESDVTVGYDRTLFVKRAWAGKRITAKVSFEVGEHWVMGTTDVLVDATVPASYVDPGATPPVVKPPAVPQPPRDFARIVVKAPAKVKSGKKITLTLTQVSGKVKVKASHQKKAVNAKVVKNRAKVVLRAPKLKRGQKSRIVSVKVTMKGVQGNDQSRTVKVKVVR